MGCYVEAKDKKQWLVDNAKMYWDDLSYCPKFSEFPEGTLPVVLLDNGLFYAAGVAFDEKEFEVFTDVRDTRPRTVWAVDIEKLKKVSPLEGYLKIAELRKEQK